MMKLKYTGSADERVIDPGGWPGGIEVDKRVTFNADNDFTSDVPKEAAEWLLENDGNFKKA
jgi:hypothetical protein